ncbi:MAG: hypothetical protein AAGD06_09910 [Acidobacteriota bacterium]
MTEPQESPIESGPGDLPDWHRIATEGEFEELLDASLAFHDAVVREFLLIGPDYVDPRFQLICGQHSNALAVVHSQAADVGVVGLIFENVTRVGFELQVDREPTFQSKAGEIRFQGLSLDVTAADLYWTAKPQWPRGPRPVTEVASDFLAGPSFDWDLKWPLGPATVE